VIEGAEGRLGATLRTMRIEKAQEIARRIYNLAAKLESSPVPGYCIAVNAGDPP
jgi:hypothetical protein